MAFCFFKTGIHSINFNADLNQKVQRIIIVCPIFIVDKKKYFNGSNDKNFYHETMSWSRKTDHHLSQNEQTKPHKSNCRKIEFILPPLTKDQTLAHAKLLKLFSVNKLHCLQIQSAHFGFNYHRLIELFYCEDRFQICVTAVA